MKIGELKALIADLPDDMVIVTSAPDHKYRRVSVSTAEASVFLKHPQPHFPDEFGEYWGEEHLSEHETHFGEVLVID